MKRVDSKEYSKEYFKTYCTGYDILSDSNGKKADPRLEVIFQLGKIRPKMMVVDYGCGRGELVRLSAKAGADAYGFDYSKEAIDFSKKLSKGEKGVHYVFINEPKIPLKERNVDVVFMADVIEHLYPEEARIVLSEFRRILKPKGKLIIHTAPNREFYDIGYVWWTRYISFLINVFWRLIFRERLITKKDPRDELEKKLHVNEVSVDELRNYLLEAGFKNMKVWYDSEFRKVRVRDKIRFTILQPNFGFLKRYFAFDVWAIAQAV